MPTYTLQKITTFTAPEVEVKADTLEEAITEVEEMDDALWFDFDTEINLIKEVSSEEI